MTTFLRQLSEGHELRVLTAAEPRVFALAGVRPALDAFGRWLKTAAASAGIAPTALRAALNGTIALPASLKHLVPATPASQPEQAVQWRWRRSCSRRHSASTTLQIQWWLPSD